MTETKTSAAAQEREWFRAATEESRQEAQEQYGKDWYIDCPSCHEWLGISGWMSLDLESHCFPASGDWPEGRPCGRVVHCCGADIDRHSNSWSNGNEGGAIPLPTRTLDQMWSVLLGDSQP